MGGTKLTDLVVEQSDRGGEMLEGALSFNVHEEYFGMVEEEMVVQSGHTQLINPLRV